MQQHCLPLGLQSANYGLHRPYRRDHREVKIGNDCTAGGQAPEGRKPSGANVCRLLFRT